LQALVVDAGGVLALSVQVTELLDLSGGHLLSVWGGSSRLLSPYPTGTAPSVKGWL
jgi:hypothetical protein